MIKRNVTFLLDCKKQNFNKKHIIDTKKSHTVSISPDGNINSSDKLLMGKRKAKKSSEVKPMQIKKHLSL